MVLPCSLKLGLFNITETKLQRPSDTDQTSWEKNKPTRVGGHNVVWFSLTIDYETLVILFATFLLFFNLQHRLSSPFLHYNYLRRNTRAGRPTSFFIGRFSKIEILTVSRED